MKLILHTNLKTLRKNKSFKYRTLKLLKIIVF